MWLDPLAAQQEVNNILAALITVDEKNAAYYKENAEKFNKQLSELDQDYKKALTNTARKDMITSHVRGFWLFSSSLWTQSSWYYGAFLLMLSPLLTRWLRFESFVVNIK